MAEQLAERCPRQRRVLADDHIDQRVVSQLRILMRGGRFARSVQTNPTLAPRNPQQAVVVHRVEQLRRRVRRAAEPVLHLAVREVRIDLARVHDAAFAHVRMHGMRLLPARVGPNGARCAWVHQRVNGARHEAVVDEVVLLDVELRITPLEVTGAVVGNTVAQRQVLCPRRRANRVGLDEAELVDRAFESRRLEEAARKGEAAHLIDVDRHAGLIVLGKGLALRIKVRSRPAAIHSANHPHD